MNLDLWGKHAAIPTKHVKEITGKPYKGSSPKPHYIIWCLTDMFGPVGKGFGWRVVAEDFTQLGDTNLHWCRIVFWWADADGRHEVEAYGQTKAMYPSKNGVMVDEDAPKKSLTDAVVKAASQLGIAADIFLGRWDESKYVSDLKAEERKAEQPALETATPAEIETAVDVLSQAASVGMLEDLWRGYKKDVPHLLSQTAVIDAARKRKSELMQQKDAA